MWNGERKRRNQQCGPLIDYDGEGPWSEIGQTPTDEYQDDVETNANQYRNTRRALHQYESALDNLLETRKHDCCKRVSKQEWQIIRNGNREVCMNMRREINDATAGCGIDEMKEKAQKELVEQQHDKNDAVQHLAMFEKGNKKNERLQADEDSSGEEEDICRLICNMAGCRWGALRFPIIVDSGACVSVMPTGWCEHAALKDTPQARAGEYFRAANGHKVYNHGE